MSKLIKIIQVNIYKGKYLEALVDFLQRENPDIITLQEVSAGVVNFYRDQSNIFDLLKNKLPDYKVVFHSDIEISDSPSALFGNSVFAKDPIVSSQVLQLSGPYEVNLAQFNSNQNDVWAKLPRHMLDAVVDIDGVKIHVISTHFRRIAPPIDNPESTRQAQIIVDYLKSLDDAPYIMGGDFNMPPQTEVIRRISSVSNNLMADSNVNQTLNPRVHELGENGYLVDFVFTSKHFKKISLNVPQVDVSDHLPVVAELEFEPTPERHSEPRPSLRAGEES